MARSWSAGITRGIVFVGEALHAELYSREFTSADNCEVLPPPLVNSRTDSITSDLLLTVLLQTSPLAFWHPGTFIRVIGWFGD